MFGVCIVWGYGNMEENAWIMENIRRKGANSNTL